MSSTAVDRRFLPPLRRSRAGCSRILVVTWGEPAGENRQVRAACAPFMVTSVVGIDKFGLTKGRSVLSNLI
jgi:hypothetical protein